MAWLKRVYLPIIPAVFFGVVNPFNVPLNGVVAHGFSLGHIRWSFGFNLNKSDHPGQMTGVELA